MEIEITGGIADSIFIASVVYFVLSLPIYLCYWFIVTLGDEGSFLYRIPFIAHIRDAIDSNTRIEGTGEAEGAEFDPAGRGGAGFDLTGGEEMVPNIRETEDDMDPISRMFGIEVVSSSLGMLPMIIGFSIAIVLLSIEGLL